MAIQTKVILRFNGVKVDALGTNWNVVKSVPGGVRIWAGWSDRQLQRCRNHVHAVGRHDAHLVPRVSLRKDSTRRSAWCWAKSSKRLTTGRSGQRWHHLTLQGCLCREVTFAVNNEAGDIMMQIGRITATRRVPY